MTGFELPWLPAGRIVTIEDRGEFFVRHHRHPDAARPTVLLLHGWTASADLQFVTAYEALAQHCSFVAIDHRGHGRGLRTAEVTVGGVDTRELSSQTMEARKVPGLYFIGEAVDVTGHLGGFNFQWAWASGHACGEAA